MSADEDTRLLASIGYKQELRREFTAFSTISYAVSILGVLGSVPATFNAPLASGGPATAIFAWLIGSIMALFVASSVAELVSAYPTAGGMYFVCAHVVPEKKVPEWAWIVGWCNFLGQTAGVTSVAYSVAQMILAGVCMWSMAEDGSTSFTPTAGQTVVLAALLLVCFGIVCSLSTKRLHQVIQFFAPINGKLYFFPHLDSPTNIQSVIATMCICVALLVYTPTENRHSFRSVTSDFMDGSGWGSKLFSFLLGFLAVAWTMTDYDGTTHMSEETHNAAILGPLAILTAVFSSGVFGFLLTLTLCLCLGDITAALGSPTGMAAAQVFFNAGGKSGGLLMWSFVILVQIFTGCSAMLADSRMAYAFARDGGFPYSHLFSKIHSSTQTPRNAVVLVVVSCLVLLPIALRSTQTIVAIFSVTAPALDLSYVAVIIARRVYEHRIDFVPGPFTLGRWGRTVNNIAISWVVSISIILFCPPQYPITSVNMNYGVFVASVIALFAWGWWFLGADRTYAGPRTKAMLPRTVEGTDEEGFDDAASASLLGYSRRASTAFESPIGDDDSRA